MNDKHFIRTSLIIFSLIFLFGFAAFKLYENSLKVINITISSKKIKQESLSCKVRPCQKVSIYSVKSKDENFSIEEGLFKQLNKNKSYSVGVKGVKSIYSKRKIVDIYTNDA